MNLMPGPVAGLLTDTIIIAVDSLAVFVGLFACFVYLLTAKETAARICAGAYIVTLIALAIGQDMLKAANNSEQPPVIVYLFGVLTFAVGACGLRQSFHVGRQSK